MKLIFIHGSGGWGGVWKYQLQAFPDAVAPTLPGHPDGEVISTVERYVHWVKGFIQRNGYREVVLAGHSLGGAIAITYALTYPQDLKAIILIGTGARLRVLPAYLQELEEAVRGDRKPWIKRMEERYARVDPAFARELMEKHLRIGPAPQLNDLRACDRFDLMERVKEIKLPTLILCGIDDVMTPVKYHDYLERNIPGSKKVVIPGTTHYILAEKPGEFNQAVRDFVATLPA